jgi:hypothetical protein
MEKERVIQMRNKLKAGENLPVIIYIDNLFKKIDESNVLQFTKWDDENGILYSYSLTDPLMDRNPSNVEGTISLFATDYEMIQAMEVPRMPITILGDSIDALECITPEWKQRIIERFELALNPELVDLKRSDINAAMGIIDGQKALNDNDDYYAGRYTQSFKETRLMAERNAYAEKVAKEKKAAEENK